MENAIGQMEITVDRKIEIIKSVTVQLPAYYKTVAHQFKIISKDCCISITESGIQTVHGQLPFNVGAVKSTQKEFEKALIETGQNLKKLLK